MEETIQNPQLPNPNLNPQPVEEPKSSLSTIGAKAGLVGGLGAGLVRSFNKRKTIGKGAITTLGSGALMSGLGYIAGNIGDSVIGKVANLGGDQNMTDLYTAAMLAKHAADRDYKKDPMSRAEVTAGGALVGGMVGTAVGPVSGAAGGALGGAIQHASGNSAVTIKGFPEHIGKKIFGPNLAQIYAQDRVYQPSMLEAVGRGAKRGIVPGAVAGTLAGIGAGAYNMYNTDLDEFNNELVEASQKRASEDGDVSVAAMAAKGTALGAGAGLFGAVAGNAANDANVARRIVNGTNTIFPGAIDTSTKLKLMGQGALNGVKRLGFKGAMGSAAVGAGLGLGSYTGKALFQNYQNSKTANYGEIKGDDNMSDLLQAAYMAKLAANPVPQGTYRGGQGPVVPADMGGRGPVVPARIRYTDNAPHGQGPVVPGGTRGQGPVTPAAIRYTDNAPGGQGPVNADGPNLAERAYATAKRKGSYAYDAAAEAGTAAKARGNALVEYAKANPKRVGGGVLGAAAAAGAGIYAYNHMQEKAAGYIDEPSYEEVLMAKMAAEEMYAECVEKLAFAEQLYEEADFLQGGYEKLAADNGSGEPVSWVDQLRTPVGATMTGAATAAGMVGGALLAKGRGATAMGMGAGAVAGGLLGAGTAAAGLGAVHAFTEQHRQARAAQYQATPGM